MGRGCLGFGRNLGEIIPTSLPELPIQLRDLGNNQKSLKTHFLFFYVFKSLLYFAMNCYILRCFPMLFHPGDPVNTVLVFSTSKSE